MKAKNTEAKTYLKNFKVGISVNFKTIIILDVFFLCFLISNLINLSLTEFVYSFVPENTITTIYLLLALFNIYFFMNTLYWLPGKKIKLFSILMIIIAALFIAYFSFTLLLSNMSIPW